ncbi:hypothetical protein Mycsm_06855 (plasmid) [Mycobacterium sp. JS623]|uniref:hypothetical protein n=1 Tax=Mycobacterium sp. JS623 TaxID=212767 RepID=UPI0002A579B4|nr:hypothetical protein [Mycobacterium sp. JS623]AGB26959.1 hypothetical protein Mycsm_06855 [Mycobacterium sp. JS623]
MSYADFTCTATGSIDGQITNFSSIQLPVHGHGNPGNLWVRVSGHALAFGDADPLIASDGPPVLRGTLFAITDPILEADDNLISACGTAGFARVDNPEEHDPDYVAAIDEVAAIQISGGIITFTIHAAYGGDVQIVAFTFAADLLIFRPTLQPSPPDNNRIRRVESERAKEIGQRLGCLTHRK